MANHNVKGRWFAHQFTTAQLDTMRDMYEAGKRFADIAVSIGLGASAERTVRRRCDEFGVKSATKRATAITKQRWRDNPQ